MTFYLAFQSIRSIFMFLVVGSTKTPLTSLAEGPIKNGSWPHKGLLTEPRRTIRSDNVLFGRVAVGNRHKKVTAILYTCQLFTLSHYA